MGKRVKRNGDGAVSVVINKAHIHMTLVGEGWISLEGVYESVGGEPVRFSVKWHGDKSANQTEVRTFDRMLPAMRSYRRFVCLSQEVSK